MEKVNISFRDTGTLSGSLLLLLVLTKHLTVVTVFHFRMEITN